MAVFQLICVEYYSTFLIICMLLGGTESHRYCSCLFGTEAPSFPHNCDATKDIMAVNSASTSHSKDCALWGNNRPNCDCSCSSKIGSANPLVELFKECEGIPINRCLSILKHSITLKNMTQMNFITVDYSCLPKPRRYCSCVNAGLYGDFASTCDVVVIANAFVLYGGTSNCQHADVEGSCDQVIPLLPWLQRSRLDSFSSSCTGQTPATCRESLRNTTYPETISPDSFRRRLSPISFFIEYHCIHLSNMMDMCNHQEETKSNTNSTYISSPGYPDRMSAKYGSCRCNVTSTASQIVQVLRWAVQFEMAGDSCVGVTTQGTRGSCLKSANRTENVQTPFSITYTANRKYDNRFLFYVQGKEHINIHCERLDSEEDKALTDVMNMCESSETNISSVHIISPGFPQTLSSNYESCQCDVTSFSEDEVGVSYKVVKVEMAGDTCVQVKTSGLGVSDARCLRASDSEHHVQTPFSVTYGANKISKVKLLIRVQGKGAVNIHCRRMEAKSDKQGKGIPVAIIAAAAAAAVCVLIVCAFIIFCCFRRKRSKQQSADSTSAISKYPDSTSVEIPESNSTTKSQPGTLPHQSTAIDNVYHGEPVAATGITPDIATAEDGAMDDTDGGHQMEKSDVPQQDIEDTNEEDDTILVENDVYEGHPDLLQEGGGSDVDVGDDDTILAENDVYHTYHEDPEFPPGAAPDPDSDDDSIFIENDVYERTVDQDPVGN